LESRVWSRKDGNLWIDEGVSGEKEKGGRKRGESAYSDERGQGVCMESALSTMGSTTVGR